MNKYRHVSRRRQNYIFILYKSVKYSDVIMLHNKLGAYSESEAEFKIKKAKCTND